MVKLTIKEKKPYDSWEERERAESKKFLIQVLEENELSYEEINKRCEEIDKEYGELKERLEELESEGIELGHIRTMLLLLDMVE